MYLWFKALHLIFMVTWFSGLFYLPRLFVYHALATDQIGRDRFLIMERKLFWGIATPGAVLTWLFGLGLLETHAWAAFHTQRWLHWKLLLLVLLSFYHGFCYYHYRQFLRHRNRRSSTYFRVFNEVPVFFLCGITILAVLRPC